MTQSSVKRLFLRQALPSFVHRHRRWRRFYKIFETLFGGIMKHTMFWSIQISKIVVKWHVIFWAQYGISIYCMPFTYALTWTVKSCFTHSILMRNWPRNSGTSYKITIGWTDPGHCLNIDLNNHPSSWLFPVSILLISTQLSTESVYLLCSLLLILSNWIIYYICLCEKQNPLWTTYFTLKPIKI